MYGNAFKSSIYCVFALQEHKLLHKTRVCPRAGRTRFTHLPPLPQRAHSSVVQG